MWNMVRVYLPIITSSNCPVINDGHKLNIPIVPIRNYLKEIGLLNPEKVTVILHELTWIQGVLVNFGWIHGSQFFLRSGERWVRVVADSAPTRLPPTFSDFLHISVQDPLQ